MPSSPLSTKHTLQGLVDVKSAHGGKPLGNSSGLGCEIFMMWLAIPTWQLQNRKQRHVGHWRLALRLRRKLRPCASLRRRQARHCLQSLCLPFPPCANAGRPGGLCRSGASLFFFKRDLFFSAFLRSLDTFCLCARMAACSFFNRAMFWRTWLLALSAAASLLVAV